MTYPNFAEVLIAWLTGLIVLGVTFGFSIMCIFVGHYERCDVEMSDFLITIGSIGIAGSAFDMIHKMANPERESKPPIVQLLQLAALGVCIWGMTQTWVFQKNPCSDLLYYTAFVASNAWWWIISLGVVIGVPIIVALSYVDDD